MEKEWFEKPWIIAFPIVIFIVFAAWYGVSQSYFVSCEKVFGVSAGCAPIRINGLFTPEGILLDPTGEPVVTDNRSIPDLKKALSLRYSGRMVWMFTFIMNAVCALGAWVIAAFTVRKWTNTNVPTGKNTKKTIIGTLAELKWVALLTGGATLIGFLSVQGSDALIESVYPSTIMSWMEGGISKIAPLMNFIHAVTYLSIVTLLVAMCIVCFPTRPERIGDDKSTAKAKKALEILGEKKSFLNILLYTSTALLVISVARMHATLGWTTYFMTSNTVAGAQTFYMQLLTVIGGFYTLMLSCVYLPVAFVIFQRGKAAQEKLNKAGTVDSKDKSKDPDTVEPVFSFSFANALPKILAIIAPFLTGPFVDLLKYLVTGT